MTPDHMYQKFPPLNHTLRGPSNEVLQVKGQAYLRQKASKSRHKAGVSISILAECAPIANMKGTV